MERHAQRRAAGRGALPDACPTSTWIGWTSSSRRLCCRNTPEVCSGDTNPEYDRVQGRGSLGPASAVIMPRCGRCASSYAACPAMDPLDPGYRRLRYVRYADDILLGFTGPKAEAEEIKRRLAQFLQEDLKLELSETKTLITHARTGAARFLGYEITIQHANQQAHRVAAERSTARSGCGCPRTVIKAKCARYMQRGKPAEQPGLMNEQDHTIIGRYGAEYRGIVQYYLLAGDVGD